MLDARQVAPIAYETPKDGLICENCFLETEQGKQVLTIIEWETIIGMALIGVRQEVTAEIVWDYLKRNPNPDMFEDVVVYSRYDVDTKSSEYAYDFEQHLQDDLDDMTVKATVEVEVTLHCNICERELA